VGIFVLFYAAYSQRESVKCRIQTADESGSGDKKTVIGFADDGF